MGEFFDREIRVSQMDPNASIASQGRLTIFRGAMFTAINDDGINQVPGFVIDFDAIGRGSELIPQRLSLQLTSGQNLLDVVVNALGILLSEDQIERIMEVVMAEAKIAVMDPDHVSVIHSVANAEAEQEGDPNVR